MNLPERRQANRVRFLSALYELADGRSETIYETKIAEKAGLTAEEADAAADYLQDKRLIEFVGGQGRHRGIYMLTARGIDEVERAQAAPDRPTPNLPPWNVQFQVGTMNVTNSQLQVGTHGSSQSMQVQQGDLSAAREFITAFAEAVRTTPMPEGLRAEVKPDIDALTTLVAAPKPRLPVIVMLLGSIKAVLEGALGEYLGAQWLPKLEPVLRGLGS